MCARRACVPADGKGARMDPTGASPELDVVFPVEKRDANAQLEASKPAPQVVNNP